MQLNHHKTDEIYTIELSRGNKKYLKFTSIKKQTVSGPIIEYGEHISLKNKIINACKKPKIADYSNGLNICINDIKAKYYSKKVK
jgi:hypothetical protein